MTISEYRKGLLEQLAAATDQTKKRNIIDALLDEAEEKDSEILKFCNSFVDLFPADLGEDQNFSSKLGPIDQLWVLRRSCETIEDVYAELIGDYSNKLRLAKALKLEEHICKDIPKVGRLTMELLYAEESNELKQRLKRELEILSVIHAIGQVNSDWVRNLLKECPDTATLKRKTYEELEPMLAEAVPQEKAAVLKLFITGDPLREQAEATNVDLALADELRANGHSNMNSVEKEDLNKMLQKMPKDGHKKRSGLQKLYSNSKDDQFVKHMQKKKEREQELAIADEKIREAKIKQAKQSQLEANNLNKPEDLKKLKTETQNLLKDAANKLNLPTDWNSGSLTNDMSATFEELERKYQSEVKLVGDFNYQTHEEIASKASAGLARKAMYISGDYASTTGKTPEKMLLAPFTFVEWLSPDKASESVSFEMYDAHESDSFKKSIDSCGFSIGASLSVQAWGVPVSASMKHSQESSKEESVRKKAKTSFAVQYAFVRRDVKVFHVPSDAMRLSADAKEDASRINSNNLMEANRFIKRYGDHINETNFVLGGYLLRKTESTTEEAVTETEMKQAFSEAQEASASAGYCGVGASVTTENHSVKASTDNEATRELKMTTKVTYKSCGPPASTTQEFESRLLNNNEFWYVIDRGEADRSTLVPVWELLEREGYDLAAKAVCLAWQHQTLQMYTSMLPLDTMQIMEDFSQDEVSKLKPEVQTTIDCFKEAVKKKLSNGTMKAYLEVETLGDVVVFAQKMEAALASSISILGIFIKELVSLKCFIDLLMKIIRSPDKDYNAGKQFIQSVFGDKNMNALLLNSRAASTEPKVKKCLVDFFQENNKIKEEGTIVIVPLVKLPDHLEEMASYHSNNTHKLTEEVCNVLGCSLWDSISLSHYDPQSESIVDAFCLIVTNEPYNFNMERRCFPLDIDSAYVQEIAEQMRRVLNPPAFKVGDYVIYSDYSVECVDENAVAYNIKEGKVVSSSSITESVTILHADGHKVEVPAWKLYCAKEKDTLPFAHIKAVDKNELPITCEGNTRVTLDCPSTSLGDSLRHRLGLLLHPTSAQIVITEEEPRDKIEDDDSNDGWGSDDESNSSISPTSSPVRTNANTRDIIEFFRSLDPYDTTRATQMLLNLELPIPVYYRQHNEKVEHYMATVTMRHAHATIAQKVNNSGDKIARKINIATDTSLPRIAFVTLTDIGHQHCRNLNVIDNLFGAKFPAMDEVDCKSGSMSIEIGVWSVADQSHSIAVERSNWMVMHLKGDEETILTDKQVKLMLAASDLVIVQTKNDSSSIECLEYLRNCANKDRVFSWSYAVERETKKKIRHILGDEIYTSQTLCKLLAKYKIREMGNQCIDMTDECGPAPLPDDKCRCRLVDAAIITDIISPSPERGALSKALNTLGTNVHASLPGSGLYRQHLKMGKLYAEQHHKVRKLRHIGDKYGNEGTKLQSEINSLEDKLLKHAYKAEVPQIVENLLGVLKMQTRFERLLGMKELATQIVLAEEPKVKSLREEVENMRDLYSKSDPAEREEMQKLYSSAQTNLAEKQTSIVHVWRELALFYENNPERFEEAPKLAARLFCDGEAMELVNGDAGRVTMKWVGKVMEETKKILEKRLGHAPRVQTLSVAGVQSTGKSTLLNTMFGSEFNTSMGACTRGINMQLVPSEGWDTECDFVLLLDTEGICNPLYKSELWYDWHNNWLATISILAVNTCILISNNEDHTMVQQVLPFAMLSYIRTKNTLENCGFAKRHLRFVYNRVNTLEANEKLKDNIAGLRDTFQNAVKDLSIQNKKGGDRHALHAAFSNIKDEDFSYLGGNLNDVDGYGNQVVNLRKSINEQLMDDNKKFKGVVLDEWWKLMVNLLEASDAQDFALSFSSVVALNASVERKKVISEEQTRVSSAWANAYKQVDEKLQRFANVSAGGESNSTISKDDLVVDLNKNKDLSDTIANATKVITDLLEREQHKNYAEEDKEQWKRFLEEQNRRHTQLLKTAFDTLTTGAEQERQIQEEFLSELKTLTRDENDREKLKKSPEYKERKFKEVYQRFLAKARKDAPTMNVNVMVRKHWPNDLNMTYYPGAKRNKKQGKTSSWSQKLKGGVSEIAKAIMQQIRRPVNNSTDEVDKDMQKINEDIRNILATAKKHVGPYGEHCVQNAIEKVREWQKLKYIDANQVLRIAIEVREELTCILAAQQEDWEAKNNLYQKLRNMENDIRQKFDFLCSGIEGLELLKENLLVDLRRGAKEYSHYYLIELYQKSVINARWMKSEQALIAEVNFDLLKKVNQSEQRNVVDCLNSHKHHFDKVQEKLMWESVKEDPKDSHEKRKIEVMNMFKTLKSNVKRKTVQGKVISGSRMREFLVNSSLPHFPLAHLPAVSDLCDYEEILGPDDFIDDLANRFEDEWPEEPWHRRPSWNEVRDSLKQRQDSTGLRARCGAHCPRCKMICLQDEGHEGKHDCFHQPKGLVGVSWEHSRELSEKSCSDSVRDDDIIVGKGSYKDFEKFYPEWCLPVVDYPKDRMYNGIFRGFLFKECQDELVRRYKKKRCTKLPEALPTSKQFEHELDQIRKNAV